MQNKVDLWRRNEIAGRLWPNCHRWRTTATEILMIIIINGKS